MRLSTEAGRDEERGLAIVHAALDAGIRLFDTARAYGWNDAELGHNERFLARALKGHAGGAGARVVTKGGMRRPEGLWRTDGRTRTLLADAEASAAALDRPPDVWLLHAPDPRVSFESSLRAVAQIHERGLARGVGVSNVNRTQLQRALELAPITAVEVALSPFHGEALKGGVIELCQQRGIQLIAHSPLGGPARAARLARDSSLSARDASAVQVALAWLLELAPVIVPIPGAGTPQHAREAAAAAGLVLNDSERMRFAERFPGFSWAPPEPSANVPSAEGEVVLVMGIAGAGKSRAAHEWASRGYLRLNRDERGGTLRGLARVLASALEQGARRVVLDNTYLTRAARADVIAAASRHHLAVRCVFLDTPPPQAQINLCGRLVDQFGGLPEPEALRSSRRAGVMGPLALFRQARELEPPSLDEGFVQIDVVPFVREPDQELRAGAVTPLDAPDSASAGLPTLSLGWRPGAGTFTLDGDVATCPHPAGPPICWCRPPLPGAVVAWAHRRRVDVARITVLGSSPAFRSLARAFVGGSA